MQNIEVTFIERKPNKNSQVTPLLLFALQSVQLFSKTLHLAGESGNPLLHLASGKWLTFILSPLTDVCICIHICVYNDMYIYIHNFMSMGYNWLIRLQHTNSWMGYRLNDHILIILGSQPLSGNNASGCSHPVFSFGDTSNPSSSPRLWL